MKKKYLSIFGFAFALALAFLASGKAFATELIDELTFTTDVTHVDEGELPEFTAETTTDFITIEPYGGNTKWFYKGEADSGWVSFGSETPTAVDDGSTLYAMGIKVMLQSSAYEIADHPTINWNESNFTETGYTGFQKKEWGGYVFIDLGRAGGQPGPQPEDPGEGGDPDPGEGGDPDPSGEENPEPTFTLTRDFNGGATYDGKDTFVTEGVSYAPFLGEPFLISCIEENEEGECHGADVKKGKELAYVTVNGERHDLGPDDGFMFNKDTVIKYYWNDIDLEEYHVEAEDESYTVDFEGLPEHNYDVFMSVFRMDMTDEELSELEIDPKDYEETKATMAALVGDEGTLLAYLNLEVYDLTDFNSLHEGPFDFKIVVPEGMEGFNTYKFFYVTRDENGDWVLGDAVTLTVKDGYLYGTLPHLSEFLLVGSTEVPGAPNTGRFTKIVESAAFLPICSVIAAVTLAGVAVYYSKRV